MFIKIKCRLHQDRNPLANVWFDVARIIKVTDEDVAEGCVFWFHDADVGGALPYDAPEYKAEALVEVVMQARMHPAQFVPSVNVGKAKPQEPHSTGSHQFRANEKSST